MPGGLWSYRRSPDSGPYVLEYPSGSSVLLYSRENRQSPVWRLLQIEKTGQYAPLVFITDVQMLLFPS